MYNTSTSTEIQITTNGLAWQPVIYEDRIVWKDGRNGNFDIYICTVSGENIGSKVEQTPEQTQSPNASGKGSTKMPGFEIAFGIVFLLGVFLYKRG